MIICGEAYLWFMIARYFAIVRFLNLGLIMATVLLFACLPARSQHLLILKSHPGRALPSPVFLAGDFNQWEPSDSNYRFENGRLQIDLKVDSIAAKLTGGNWTLAEANADGSPRPNRNIRLKNRDTIYLHWYAWEDHQDRPPRGVQLITDSMACNMSGALRKIWVYLPRGYSQNTFSYPVFYFHDGQNLFEGIRGSPEKWEMAKTLDALNLPLIVVGIEHGEERRIEELSLYAHKDYGGGSGRAYLQHIDQALIPFIDSNFRTKPEAPFRYIGGSSLGGLISLAACHHYPQRFGGALIFSPAYWFNPQILEDLSETEARGPTLLYQMCGDSEGSEPQKVIDDMLKCEALLKEQDSNWRLAHKVVAGGQHNEELWREELPEALQWFFRQSPLNEYLEDVRRN